MKLPLSFTLALTAISTALYSGCTTIGGSMPAASLGPLYPGIASYMVVDTQDKKILLSTQPDTRRPVASLTKIATAIVVLDAMASSQSSLDEMLTVPPSVSMLGSSGLGLQAGDGISVRDAMYGGLLGSDNFCAEALAMHCGQKINAIRGTSDHPITAFVKQMNALAANLNMSNTRFVNAHGLDVGGQSGYSTAADMARLTMHALTKGNFTFFCSQTERKLSVMSGGQRKLFLVRNTNELLGKDRIDGVKTGTTNAAGPCLIISASRPSSVIPQADRSTVVVPHRLVVVLLGASDRFNQGRQLLSAGWAAYDQWHAAGRTVANANELLVQPTPAP